MKFFESIKNWWKRRRDKKAQQKKLRKEMTTKEKVIDDLKLLGSAYLIAFVLRIFLIEAYQIPSQSMVPNLMVRDMLIVQKLGYGTILPVIDAKLPGFTQPEPNDIVVFKSPEWESPGKFKEFITLITLSLVNLDNTFDTPKNLVKRLVAGPGDTLSMSNRTLYLNSEALGTSELASKIQTEMMRLQNIGVGRYDILAETNGFDVRVIQYEDRTLNSVAYNPEAFEDDSLFENFYFRLHSQLKLGFPEITIPQKDVAVDLENANYYFLYLMKMLIERETDKTVLYYDGSLYLEGVKLTEWFPEDDYYFAMGDNRDNSTDCRYFGFIPKKNIFGKILFRYFPPGRFTFNPNLKPEKLDKVNFIVD